MRCESVPDPQIEHPQDAIINVTACAICGSDLHIFDGVIPRVKQGEIDPSFVITHRAALKDGPELYETFRDKKDGCIKVVMKP